MGGKPGPFFRPIGGHPAKRNGGPNDVVVIGPGKPCLCVVFAWIKLDGQFYGSGKKATFPGETVGFTSGDGKDDFGMSASVYSTLAEGQRFPCGCVYGGEKGKTERLRPGKSYRTDRRDFGDVVDFGFGRLTAVHVERPPFRVLIGTAIDGIQGCKTAKCYQKIGIIKYIDQGYLSPISTQVTHIRRMRGWSLYRNSSVNTRGGWLY